MSLQGRQRPVRSKGSSRSIGGCQCSKSADGGVRSAAAMVIGSVSSTLVIAAGSEAACLAERPQNISETVSSRGDDHQQKSLQSDQSSVPRYSIFGSHVINKPVCRRVGNELDVDRAVAGVAAVRGCGFVVWQGQGGHVARRSADAGAAATPIQIFARPAAKPNQGVQPYD